jgi:hypothetical protein
MVPIVALRLATDRTIVITTEIHLSVQRYVGTNHYGRRYEHGAIWRGFRGSAQVL